MGRGQRGREIAEIAVQQQATRVCHQAPIQREGQSALPRSSGILNMRFHGQQQLFHLSSPRLVLLFLHKGQVAQHMNIAKGMATVILPVALPAIMHTHAGKALQDADGLQGLNPASSMYRVMGQGRGRTDVHPIPLAHHIQARFVLVQHITETQGRFGQLLNGVQMSGATLDQGTQSCLAHRHAQQIFQDFGGTGQRHEVLLHQRDRHGPNAFSILQGSADGGGKGGAGELVALRTLLLFSVMLAHHQAQRRHIDHLSTFDGCGPERVQVRLAVLASLDDMYDHFIRRCRKPQALARMARLSTRFLSALLAQALGLPPEPIRRGRQVAIVTVFGQPLFHGLQPLLQLRDQVVPLRKLVISLLDLFAQHLIFCSKLDQFFFWLHACYFTRLSALLQVCRRPE